MAKWHTWTFHGSLARGLSAHSFNKSTCPMQEGLSTSRPPWLCAQQENLYIFMDPNFEKQGGDKVIKFVVGLIASANILYNIVENGRHVIVALFWSEHTLVNAYIWHTVKQCLHFLTQNRQMRHLALSTPLGPLPGWGLTPCHLYWTGVGPHRIWNRICATDIRRCNVMQDIAFIEGYLLRTSLWRNWKWWSRKLQTYQLFHYLKCHDGCRLLMACYFDHCWQMGWKSLVCYFDHPPSRLGTCAGLALEAFFHPSKASPKYCNWNNQLFPCSPSTSHTKAHTRRHKHL